MEIVQRIHQIVPGAVFILLRNSNNKLDFALKDFKIIHLVFAVNTKINP